MNARKFSHHAGDWSGLSASGMLDPEVIFMFARHAIYAPHVPLRQDTREYPCSLTAALEQ